MGIDVVRVSNLVSGDGLAATEEILSHEPDGVFCANDLVALGVMKGLLERGVAIPDDIALVGYDDMIFAEMATVSLTSIRQPAYEIGVAAASLLLAEINEESHVHRHIAFTPDLIVRRSTVQTASSFDKRDHTSANPVLAGQQSND